MKNRFLQIHFLSSYPGSLLNRDDVGFAKRIPFGGVSRTRISSQCLKRHWRTHEGEYALNTLSIPMSIRSRYTFEKLIFEPLAAEFPPEKVRIIVNLLIDKVLGKSEKPKKESAEVPVNKSPKTQITVLGKPEIDYLLQLARSLCTSIDNPKSSKEIDKVLDSDLNNNFKAMRNACMGLDGAMFGRMVTSDILARVDAAVHVAHAFTVHAESTDNDYFTAVDDLVPFEGSAHLDNTELTSGLYYGYVVIDIPLFHSNMQGCDPDVIAQVIENIIHLISRVTPGAKLGSTAPYTYAHLLLAEIGNAQPCTFANAFLKPVKEHPDLLQNTYQALMNHIAALDTMYGVRNIRALSHLGNIPKDCSIDNIHLFPAITDLASWASQLVRGKSC